jgi:hypothetical protein
VTKNTTATAAGAGGKVSKTLAEKNINETQLKYSRHDQSKTVTKATRFYEEIKLTEPTIKSDDVTVSQSKDVTVSQINDVTVSQIDNISDRQIDDVTVSKIDDVTVSKIADVTVYPIHDVKASHSYDVTAGLPVDQVSKL